MTRNPKAKKKHSEAGVALLIAIFALLLISVVAIALIVSSGTNTALQSNYRTSTAAYYAGMAGLEEGRGRLLWSNPNFINNTDPNFVPAPNGPPMGLNQVLYIVNPANSETVAPWDTSNAATYPDKEYQNEFGIDVGSANLQPTLTSVSPIPGLLPGPLFKWVRITPATEFSLNVDVDQLHLGGPLDSTSLLYYDPSFWSPGTGFKPSMIVGGGPGTARQALEVTALAVVPPNTQKLLQYVVAPLTYGLYFHATLVIPGSTTVSPTIAFQGAQNGAFQVNGTDGSGAPPPVTGCTPNAPALIGVGVSDYIGGSANVTAVTNGIPVTPPGLAANYSGGGVTPSIQDVFVNYAMQTPASLNNVVQNISQHADANISHNATEADLPPSTAMNQNNPITVVVNGSLTISNSFTGYGLLVVTGDLIANANFSWNGVVLVVGSGNVTLSGGAPGYSEFYGAFFVAHTMDTSVVPANPLPTLGLATFNASGDMGRGIYYNSCWINQALRPPTYQVLSFREIDAAN